MRNMPNLLDGKKCPSCGEELSACIIGDACIDSNPIGVDRVTEGEDGIEIIPVEEPEVVWDEFQCACGYGGWDEKGLVKFLHSCEEIKAEETATR